MRRSLIALGLVLISILVIGCSKTIVVDENAMEEQLSKKYEIKERPIVDEKLDGSFRPGIYTERGVYGDLLSLLDNDQSRNEPLKTLYLINKKGEFNEAETESFQYASAINGGIIENRGLHTRDYNFYYKNIIDNKEIKLTEYNEIYMEFMNKCNEEYLSNVGRLEGNNKYFFKILHDRKDGKVENIETTIQQILFINVETGEIFNSEIIDTSKEPVINVLYYDENGKSVMAINKGGEIKKLDLKDGNITISDYKKIDLKGYTFWEPLFSNNIEFANNTIVLTLVDEKNKGGYQGIYNIKTGKLKVTSLIEGDIFISNIMEECDMFIAYSNSEIYLAEFDEDSNVDFVYKIADSKKYSNIRAVANKEGSSIFIKKELSRDIKEVQDESPFNNIKADYSFIDIKKIKK